MSKFWAIHSIIQIWTDFHENEANKYTKKIWRKEIQNGRFFKMAVQSPILKIFFQKLYRLVLLTSIGHLCSSTYIVMRLSDIRAKNLSRPYHDRITTFFFLQNFFYCFIPMKIVQICTVDWMGWYLDVFPGFQQICCYA